MMKVLALHGSMRKNGNTSVLTDEFLRGAAEAGHETEKVELRDLTVHDCLGCGACQRNGGICVQKDDMQAICEKMKAADVIVFASPVYFYTWTSLMKKVIDRSFAVEKILSNKTFYLITAGAAPEEKYYEHMIESFRLYISCFRGEGNKEGGIVIGTGTNAPGDVRKTAAMQKAYELGKSL